MSTTKDRETYKWCNFWWDNAEKEGKRILLVGDSISCGYRGVVTEQLKGRYFVDLMGTSEFIADPSYMRELDYFLNEYEYAAIHFNNGLHGINLSNDEYVKAYRECVVNLKAVCGNIILASSTPITQQNPEFLHENNKTVISRNIMVKAFAEEFALGYDDLYSAVINHPEFKSGDGYHFNGDGYSLLGKQVSQSIIENIKG